jgi:hexosaminidase
VQWQQCEPCTALMAREGLKDYFALQGYFIRRVEKIVNALGRKIIGWDEILEGDVAASATITSWRGIEGAIHAAKAGHDAIMAPGSHLYFDHYQSRAIDEPLAIHGLTPVRETYGFQVVPDQLKGTPAEKHILGAQGHLWTEYVRTPAKAEYMILPRLTALSEVVWRGDSGRDWGDFARRLPQQIARFEHMGLNVAKTVYAVNSEVEQRGTGFSVALSVDMPDVDIRYTLDGSTPNHASDVYRQPLQLPAGGKLRARAQHRQSGELFAERRLSLIAHKALGAKIEVNTDADRTWNKMPEHSLVDGVLARDQIFQLDDWATFDGQPVEVVVNFAKATDVQLINLGFNPGRFRDFYSPTRVEVWGSTDKQQWRLLGEATGEALVPPAQLGNAITLKLDAASVKYLKVIAENGAQRFSTEDAKPVPVTLYIDEIVVL